MYCPYCGERFETTKIAAAQHLRSHSYVSTKSLAASARIIRVIERGGDYYTREEIIEEIQRLVKLL